MVRPGIALSTLLSLLCASQLAAADQTITRRVERLLEAFVGQRAPLTRIDLHARYLRDGRLALLEPAALLPRTHRFPYAQVRALHRYADNCRAADRDAVTHPELLKARRWHEVLCHPEQTLPDRFFSQPPWLHPLGGSFVARAHRSGRDPYRSLAWVARNRRFLHLAERATFGDRLDPRGRISRADRVLQTLSSEEAGALARSVRTIPSPRYLLIRERDNSALAAGRSYLVFSRARWEAFFEGQPLRLRRAKRSSACLLRDGPYCWERNPRTDDSGARRALIGAAVAVGVALLVVVFALATRLRARRRTRKERLFILRTLAHELRTPATGLNLSVEPLRDEFDRLSPAGQTAFLRLCDDIQRINRVVRSSERYLQSSGRSGRVQLSVARLDSVNEFLATVLAEIEGPVSLTPLAVDESLRADPYWLSVCVRNLVDNALEHGQPPVRVRVTRSDEALSIVVSDAGTLPDELFSVASKRAPAASRAFAKGAGSRGLGLGLNIVAHLMAGMRGSLTWRRSPTAFALELPRGGK